MATSGSGSSDEAPEEGGPVLNESVASEASKAWLAAFFASPAAHRSNAQAGYTIAAAVAAGVVGAGILADIASAPVLLQIAAAVTLGLWLWTAWLFMRAVAFQPNLGGVRHEHTPAVLAEDAIQRTWRERGAVSRKSWKAQRVARVAGIVTFLTIALVLVRPLLTSDVRATVALTEEGSKHVAPLCGEELPSVWAKLDLDDLTEDFVPVITSCGGVPGQTLRLRKSDIAGLTTTR